MDNTTRRLMMGAAGAGGATYVEDVFNTWLYNGNASSRSITNNINLSEKGGLVWIKGRDLRNHIWIDTARGATKQIISNSDGAEQTFSNTLTQFNTNGFSLGDGATVNANGVDYASWTFRKSNNFFDVVSYVGDGTNNRQIPHSLGITPGFIIVKATSVSGNGNWFCYHRSITSGNFLFLNGAGGLTPNAHCFPSVTSTYFQGTSDVDFFPVNTNGVSYIAYLFAHDVSTEGLIECGSYTGTGSSGKFVDLGWEPQWLLIKRTNGEADWIIHDSMRGIVTSNNDATLFANLANAESSVNVISVNPTGFTLEATGSGWNGNGDTYIYVAIRRGPMRTPTDATKVFNVFNTSVVSNPQSFTTDFPADFIFTRVSDRLSDTPTTSRLQGGYFLDASATTAEAAATYFSFASNISVISSYWNPGFGQIQWLSAFRRAPGFMDVVCYTGTGAVQNVSHNLGVAPELLINKSRSSNVNSGWPVYSQALGNNKVVRLNEGTASANSGGWNNTSPTSTQFTLNGYNNNGVTYVAYLFATCPGVSKVGSYTGTGTTQQINCGFTSGARFILIKRTDSTGNWYLWDSARGIVAGNDPYLLLNDQAAEVTNTDYVDTFSAGFEISSTAPAEINANGGTFIFLAVA